MQDEKTTKVLDAALDLFIRYGFRRTTMGDIAEAAEMSRPAVYLVYRNKEEIFRAVVVRTCDGYEEQGKQRIAAAGSLAEQLAAVMETWVVAPYKLINRSPEAEELYELGYSFAADVRERATKLYEAQLAEVLGSSPEVDPAIFQQHGLSLKSVARWLARATIELKRSAGSLAELKRLLATATRIHVAVLTS